MFGKRKPDELLICGDSFRYKGDEYKFHEVKHLYFKWIITTQITNFVYAGQPWEMSFFIILSDNGVVGIKVDEKTFFHGINTEKSEALWNLKESYYQLLKKTFEHRITYYMRELDEKGFFNYGECNFYPSERVIYFRDKPFPVDSTIFVKEETYVFMRKREKTFMDKMNWQLSFELPHFDTCTDTDIIFFLLDKFFGLKWEK